MRSITRIATTIGLMLAAVPAALAHPGHGIASGFDSGMAHPFSGWDHILAMLAVGFWAAQVRSRVLLPAAFLVAMVAGAAAGHWTGPMPGLEQGIAATVFVLGLLIARGVRVKAMAGAAWVGAFGLLHGAAHGAEMSASAGAVAYGCGFVLATTLLLAGGIFAGSLAATLPEQRRAAPGWALAVAGLVLLLATSAKPF
jgi:urease accessory protein